MPRWGSAPRCEQDSNAVPQQARPCSPSATVTSASDFIRSASREQAGAVFNSPRGRLPVWAGRQPLAGTRGRPGSPLVSARAPPGPLSRSSSAANGYSSQMEIVVMPGLFPVKGRACETLSLLCLAEPNREHRLLWLRAEGRGSSGRDCHPSPCSVLQAAKSALPGKNQPKWR